jgi:hypothetical protein
MWVNRDCAGRAEIPVMSAMITLSARATSAVGPLIHERSKSNNDFACSLIVLSDTIEDPPDFFQVWRLSVQPV